MRRMILGGLGIALGVMGRPAFAQQFPGQPATHPDPVKRAAGLGQPMALPDAEQTDSGVPPAGLLARGQYPQPGSTGVPYPMPMGAPITGPGGSYPLGSP